MITLNIIVCCNTTIRLWSVRYVLVACRQVVVWCRSLSAVCWHFSNFSLSPRFPHVWVGLSLQTGVRSLSACSHRFDPYPLCFCRFPLVWACSLGILIITQTLSAYSHQFDPRPLYSHGHQIIRPPCFHGYRSGPSSIAGWVHTSSEPLHPSCQWTWGLLSVESHDLLGAWSMSGSMRVDSTCPAC